MLSYLLLNMNAAGEHRLDYLFKIKYFLLTLVGKIYIYIYILKNAEAASIITETS